MNYRKKIVLTLAASGILILSAVGCNSQNTGNSGENAESDGTLSSIEWFNEDEMFTERDQESGYDESSSVVISLEDDNITCDSENVEISESTVTILEEGTYILSGTLTNGQITVDAEDTDKIQLVLDGVNVNCDTSAALYVKQADKVFITLAADTENILTNQQEFIAVDDNNVDAVIFSKEDMTLNGSGSLTVNAAYGHGIVSKDDLVFTGGSYQITAASHAVSGKDSVRIADGSFVLHSGKDGIHAENTEDEAKGFIYISGGSLQITAGGDGMDASYVLQADGGEIQIKTNGSGTEEASTKGMKAEGNLLISKGAFTIDSADDAIHSNSNIVIRDGDFHIVAGDDGIHADAAVLISGGKIAVEESYEGIEGQTIEVTDGIIDVISSDDGLNAAGGNDQSGFGEGRQPDQFISDDSCFIQISGGTISINASGDGIDSNGNLYVSGGETYVSGPADDGNGALDYAGEAQISGGVFVAVGSSGMAQNFGEDSSQGVMLVNFAERTEGEVVLTDSSGLKVVSYIPKKAYNSILISCPEIKQGETYTLTAGEQSSTIEMTNLIYGSGGMGAGMGGMDNPGKMPNGGLEQPDGGTQPPDGGLEQPNGGTQPPDGGSEIPDGEKQRPDRGLEMPGGELETPDGKGSGRTEE